MPERKGSPHRLLLPPGSPRGSNPRRRRLLIATPPLAVGLGLAWAVLGAWAFPPGDPEGGERSGLSLREAELRLVEATHEAVRRVAASVPTEPGPQ